MFIVAQVYLSATGLCAADRSADYGLEYAKPHLLRHASVRNTAIVGGDILRSEKYSLQMLLFLFTR